MNNPYNIYLHDTPSKGDFTRSNRALSSGCIRMSQADKFADFVLAANDGWTSAQKQQIFDAGTMRDIKAERSVPVYLVYQTVWHDDAGRVIYGNDIYDRDSVLLRLLQRQNDVPGQVEDEPVREKIVVPPAQKLDFRPYNE